MKGYIVDIEKVTTKNTDFRRVLYTTKTLQLVLMNIEPGEDIGVETHDLTQFLRIESGSGVVVIDGEEYALREDSAVIIPEGVEHNLINTGNALLKLYSLYGPPEHKDGTVHAAKDSAQEEHFDGVTSISQ